MDNQLIKNVVTIYIYKTISFLNILSKRLTKTVLN